ncbi:MAG: hypothetical protein RR365_02125 [Bacteroides sp.]
MIKAFNPQPFDGYNPLPDYVSGVDKHALIGTIPGGYKITLAKLTVGASMSAGNPLAHALFESYTNHGEQAKVARTRASGYDREFIAVRSAMNETGVEFHPALPCPCEAILKSLGEWFVVKNPEITEVSVVSQTCH